MSRLRIPDRFKTALRQISSLTNEAMDSVVATLSKMPPSLYDGKAAQRLRPAVVGMPSEEVTTLLDAVISLYMAMSNGGRNVSEILGDVIESINETQQDESPHQVLNEEAFRVRLTRLLSIPAVEVCAKATELQAEYPKILTSARVVTDVRPIFAQDLAANPSALIIHNLKIEFLESGKISEVYFALDASDLDLLIKTLERAKRKQTSLESFLDAKEMPLISS